MEQSIYELIARRATCRAYRPEPIPEEVLNRVLEAGCKSPSSGGFQNISIIKITDPDKRRKLVDFSRGQKFLATAPGSVVFCVDYHRTEQILAREPAPFRLPDQFQNLVMGIVDASICAQTMVLAAEEEGLGSCYNGNILNVLDQINGSWRSVYDLAAGGAAADFAGDGGVGVLCAQNQFLIGGVDPALFGS